MTPALSYHSDRSATGLVHRGDACEVKVPDGGLGMVMLPHGFCRRKFSVPVALLRATVTVQLPAVPDELWSVPLLARLPEYT